MRSILLKPDGAESPIEVSLNRAAGDDGPMQIRVGDAPPMHVDVEHIPGEGGWMRLQGRIVPFRSIRRGDVVSIWINGRTYAVDVVERTARRATGGGAAGSNAELKAPMPGTILAVNAKAGDAFEAHEPLIVLESMKMEMALSAPHAGRVRDVLCSEGELVEMGELLVRLEPSE